ncbi:uncharacterized protein LOC131697658 [Acipenser ruthenus]|uniref:uncharacterized protein LOC131697658 n=1 Tax=Acipenser ruthenus TaxID=7906 RepID=UPI002740667D|nr:uncharacterized protein LOC131697658 [Acipenser ruthenus]
MSAQAITEDEEGNVIHRKTVPIKGVNVQHNVFSDLKTPNLKREFTKIHKNTSKRPSTTISSCRIDGIGALRMIDTIDREGDAFADSTYATAGTYASVPENKPGKRIPKAGAFAEAGVGRAKAEFSMFEAEAKGPNAAAGAEVSVLGASAIARAELASASASAGPVGVKVGLGFDTGASVGVNGIEVKFLGTGFSIGQKTSVSVLGSEVSCSVM